MAGLPIIDQFDPAPFSSGDDRELDPIVDQLITEHQADLLRTLGQEPE